MSRRGSLPAAQALEIWRSFGAGARIRGEGKAREGASRPGTRGSYQIGGGGERSGLRQVRVKSEACIAGRKSAYTGGVADGKLIWGGKGE